MAVQKSSLVSKIETALAKTAGSGINVGGITVGAPKALLVGDMTEALDIVYRFVADLHSGRTPVEAVQTYGFPDSSTVPIQRVRKIFNLECIADEAANCDVLCLQVIEDSPQSGAIATSPMPFPAFFYQVSRRNRYCAVLIDMTPTLGTWSPFNSLSAMGAVPPLPLYPVLVGVADLRPYVLEGEHCGAVIIGHERHIEMMESFPMTVPREAVGFLHRHGLDTAAVKHDMTIRAAEAQALAVALRQIPGARVGYPVSRTGAVERLGSVVWVTLPVATAERDLRQALQELQQRYGVLITEDFAGPDMIVRAYSDADKRSDIRERPGLRISLGCRNERSAFAELIRIAQRFSTVASGISNGP